jgi:hypothetical protein
MSSHFQKMTVGSLIALAFSEKMTFYLASLEFREKAKLQLKNKVKPA